MENSKKNTNKQEQIKSNVITTKSSESLKSLGKTNINNNISSTLVSTNSIINSNNNNNFNTRLKRSFTTTIASPSNVLATPSSAFQRHAPSDTPMYNSPNMDPQMFNFSSPFVPPIFLSTNNSDLNQSRSNVSDNAPIYSQINEQKKENKIKNSINNNNKIKNNIFDMDSDNNLNDMLDNSEPLTKETYISINGKASSNNTPTSTSSSFPMSRRATTLDVPGLTKSKVSPNGTIAAQDVGSKLVIVMVGLPARGKSYITKKLTRYLNWLQHETRIFNVGNTRRQAGTRVGPASHPIPDQLHYSNQLSSTSSNSRDTNSSLPSSGANTQTNSPINTFFDTHYSNTHDKTSADQSTSDTNTTSSNTHDSSFFAPNNLNTYELRESWAMQTLDELLDYVLFQNGSVGILDATNTTVRRRQKVLDRVKERSNGMLKVLFLESICTDKDLLEQNFLLKLSGPDYKDKDPKVALEDFRARVRNYEKVYETIGDEEESVEGYQYIKMIDVGRKVVAFNIQGFLAGQAVFYLLNFNLQPRQIWLTRHGESCDNISGRIGGDSQITPSGKKYARALARFMNYNRKKFREHQLEDYYKRVSVIKLASSLNDSAPTTPKPEPEEPPFCVWTSMLTRAIQTAKYFDDEHYDIKEMRMLNEIGAGAFDGVTHEYIRERYPIEYASRMAHKYLYRYPGIGGESYLDVINRVRPVIVELERMQDNVLIIAHRVVCKVLLAYFTNLTRTAISDLDVPLHTLYVLEPKPYGVDWAMYEYNEKSDWFFKVETSSNPYSLPNMIRSQRDHRTNRYPIPQQSQNNNEDDLNDNVHNVNNDNSQKNQDNNTTITSMAPPKINNQKGASSHDGTLANHSPILTSIEDLTISVKSSPSSTQGRLLPLSQDNL